MINDQRQPRNIPPGDIPRPGVIAPRTLRTSSGSRDIPRRSRPPDDLLAISWHLEPRDYVIAHLLPVHWVPGRLSARYVALYHGRPAPSSRAVRDERDTHPSTATRLGHLMHADGTNQFFIDLLAHARTHPQARLARWWSAARIFAKVNHNTRPDGHGVWRDGDRQVAFFLEHDTGTESHPARAAKLVGYRTLRDKGMAWPVLFWLPTTTIETHLHRHLADHADGTRGIVVATAARDHAAQHGGPAGPVWRMVGNGRRRLRLAELPGPVGPTGLAYHPGPPEPQEDPLYLLRDDTDPAPA